MSAQSLKPGWKMVKFGEVVKNANLVERDPETNGVERIVGLEHIDPENLHIRRWNSVADGTSFTRKFVLGQTLFGKRRAYQRKVAYAEFEGICSGDILTFEPKNRKVLLPELLPFICQSDAFFDHALGTSAGSLSPRTSWTALQDFEFPLPPLDEQKRIAEILWAADESLVSFEQARESLLNVADTFATDFLSRGWDTKNLGKLLIDVQYGSSKRIASAGSGTAPILRIPNVIGGRIVLDDLAFVDLPTPEVDRYRLSRGDVLIVRTNGNPEYVGRTAVVEELPEDCIYASYLIRLVPNSELLLPKYLHAALSSSLMRRTLRHEIRSSAGNYNLNTKGIKRQVLPLPPLPKQHEFVRHFESFERKISEIDSHISLLRALRLSIANQEIGAAHV
jgi:type I restriction enzyme S subunit